MNQHIFDKPIHLSELQIPKNGDSFYMLGQLLAWLNSIGYYFYPDLTKSIRFESKTGNWVICDVDKMHQKSLDPEVASWQFRDTMPEGGMELIKGLLGGYARRAYQIIDPLYPGFTDTLLKHLVPGSVLSVTRPRIQRLDMGRVLTNYGFAVNFKRDFNKPVLVRVPVEADPPNDFELLHTTIVLTLANIEITEWIKQVEAMGNNGEMFQILGAIGRREHMNTWDGMVAKIFGLNKAKRRLDKQINRQPIPHILLLTVIQVLYISNDQLGEGGMSDDAYEAFKMSLSEMLPYEPLERIECLEAIIDGMDYLAELADKQDDIMSSITLAQNSKIMLQMVLWDKSNVGGTEERLSRDEIQEQKYSWYNLSYETDKDKYTFFNYLAFLNSASSTDLQYFALSHQLFDQKQASNHLWTAIWRGLDRQRKAMEILPEVLKLVNLQDNLDLKNINILFDNNLKAYLKCLKEFGTTIESTIIEDEPTSNYFNLFTGFEEKDKEMFLNLETDIGLKLYDTFKENGLGTPTLAILQKLVNKIKKEKK